MGEVYQDGYKQHFGCCEDIPRGLLRTGERWNYPKWYIDYITGTGKRKLPSRLGKLLDYLEDETWKLNLPDIGVGTIEASRELQLADMSPVASTLKGYVAKIDNGMITDIKNNTEIAQLFNLYPRAIIAVFRITERGKMVLEEKSLP
jgi:hypothetical protein